MFASEFADRFGVQADVHQLLDYVTHGELEYGKRLTLSRRQWVVTFRHPGNARDDDRVLVIEYDTNTETDEEDIDAFEVLASAIMDSRDGALSFPDYVDEYGGMPPIEHGTYTIRASQHPVAQYTRWINAMWLFHKINDWCSTPEMRAALNDIEWD